MGSCKMTGIFSNCQQLVPKWNFLSFSCWRDKKKLKSPQKVLRAKKTYTYTPTYTCAHAQQNYLVSLACVSVNYLIGQTELRSETEQLPVQQQS